MALLRMLVVCSLVLLSAAVQAAPAGKQARKAACVKVVRVSIEQPAGDDPKMASISTSTWWYAPRGVRCETARLTTITAPNDGKGWSAELHPDTKQATRYRFGEQVEVDLGPLAKVVLKGQSTRRSTHLGYPCRVGTTVFQDGSRSESWMAQVEGYECGVRYVTRHPDGSWSLWEVLSLEVLPKEPAGLFEIPKDYTIEDKVLGVGEGQTPGPGTLP